jgi:hypothetical protein
VLIPDPKEPSVTSRTSREDLVFHRPFRLRGWSQPHPAGTYALETEEELIEGLSFPAYRRVGTTLTRATSQGGQLRQVIPVEPAEIAAVLAADQAQGDAAP